MSTVVCGHDRKKYFSFHPVTYFRAAVDFHNSKRHDCGTKHGLSLEETWRTTNWSLRVFSFIIAVCEVNAYLAMKYFGELSCTQLEFRRRLAHDLVFNGEDVDGALTRSLTVPIETKDLEHNLITVPKYSKWVDGSWKKVFNREYQQVTCNTFNCTRRVRTMCTCSPSIFRCNQCYTMHLLSPPNNDLK